MRFKKHKPTLIGTALGLIGSYLYWHFVGCYSGTCAITSKPLNSSVYGALMGGLIFSMFKKEKVKQNDISGDNQSG